MTHSERQHPNDLRDEIAIVDDARPGTLEAVVALHAAYYARHWGFGRFFEQKVARELAEFLARYDRRHDRVFLALAGEGIVGALVIDGGAPAADGAHLRWFILDDICRGRGIGRRLMDAAMTYVRAHFARCHLATFAGLDAARSLYQRAGFRLVAEVEAESWGTRVTEQRFEWARPD